MCNFFAIPSEFVRINKENEPHFSLGMHANESFRDVVYDFAINFIFVTFK